MRTFDAGRFTFPTSRVALRALVLGVREFRSCYTKGFVSERLRNTYDTGRELAHMFTARRFEA